MHNCSFTVRDFRLYDETSSSKLKRTFASRSHCPNVTYIAAPSIFAETNDSTLAATTELYIVIEFSGCNPLATPGGECQKNACATH